MESKHLKSYKIKKIGTSIAHELRTPLAGLRLYLNAIKNLLTTVELDDSIKNEIEASVANAIQLVQQINIQINTALMNLKYDDIDDAQFESISIETTIEEVINEFSSAFDAHQVIELAVDSAFLYRGNLLLTKQVLWNLLKNALFYSITAQNRKIVVSTYSLDNDNYCVIKDYGDGIKEDSKGNIFEAFVSTEKNKPGLGLTLCKKVMQAYDGSIQYRRNDEHGMTEFVLRFPKIG